MELNARMSNSINADAARCFAIRARIYKLYITEASIILPSTHNGFHDRFQFSE